MRATVDHAGLAGLLCQRVLRFFPDGPMLRLLHTWESKHQRSWGSGEAAFGRDNRFLGSLLQDEHPSFHLVNQVQVRVGGN
jgi:hypothetical protein